MVISKRVLINEVLAEASIEDILSPAWQKDANEDMDIEFYSEMTDEFWRQMQRLIGMLKTSPPRHQQEWAYENKMNPNTIKILPSIFQRMNVSWIQGVYSDKEVYSIIKQYGFDPHSEDQMFELANIELPYIVGQYIF